MFIGHAAARLDAATSRSCMIGRLATTPTSVTLSHSERDAVCREIVLLPYVWRRFNTSVVVLPKP